MMTPTSKGSIDGVDCELLHHGVAASSSSKVIACIPKWNHADNGDDNNDETELVYASNLMLNVARLRRIPMGSRIEQIWNVHQTLRTTTDVEAESATAAANVSTLTAKRVITCVKQLVLIGNQNCSVTNKGNVVLVCGFSDGTMTSWHGNHNDGTWKERILPMTSTQFTTGSDPSTLGGRSITDLDGFCNVDGSILSIITCSSGGAHYICFQQTMEEEMAMIGLQQVVNTPSNSVRYRLLTWNDDKGLKEGGGSDYSSLGVFLVGTAAPRHNKIHVMFVEQEVNVDPSSSMKLSVPTYGGSLSGHEDWITCFDWTTAANDKKQSTSSGSDSTYYLASGSQDSKIRLWKWITAKTKPSARSSEGQDQSSVTGLDVMMVNRDDTDDEEEDGDDDEEIVEGEARLEIVHGKDRSLTTSIFLEALLIGHEEMVTSLAWHPNPRQLYDQDLILVSSSMDRTMYVWSSTCGGGDNIGNPLPNFGGGVGEGVWTPVARVGSAGGILGGSVGSSLLGFLDVQIEPVRGRWIMGHAYGGALHFFSCNEESKELVLLHEGANEEKKNEGKNDMLNNAMSIEERAALIQWRAQPCITGHFREVTDLCWEAHRGEYLITVSNDQTCRTWAPVTASLDAWIEIARPQVHGYNLSSVTSLSTPANKHLLVTGADEKEIRVFDGTLSFERRLRLVSGRAEPTSTSESSSDRVERAFIPALGLSNKATAADGADEDTAGASTSSTLIPLEGDLGSSSLWPELRKLFGHNSEIVRLTSTITTRTCLSVQYSTPYVHQVLVASSTKARDIANASILLWDVESNRCVQTLSGGHRSTVTAMSFSPDGTYLASSGKDRRLCIWRRSATSSQSSGQKEFFHLASAVESSHKRIVWSVHFCPFEPTIVASGSRDGTIKLWKISDESADAGNETTVAEYVKFVPLVGEPGSSNKAEAVTSVAFAPLGPRSMGLLAVGFENGLIQLWNVPLLQNENELNQPTIFAAFDPQICHIGMVTQLAWRPTTNDALMERPLMVLASCSTDNGCRIFQVGIPEQNKE